MAELADALDLGSSVFDVQVQVLSSALKTDCITLVSGELQSFFINIDAHIVQWQKQFLG